MDPPPPADAAEGYRAPHPAPRPARPARRPPRWTRRRSPAARSRRRGRCSRRRARRRGTRPARRAAARVRVRGRVRARVRVHTRTRAHSVTLRSVTPAHPTPPPQVCFVRRGSVGIVGPGAAASLTLDSAGEASAIKREVDSPKTDSGAVLQAPPKNTLFSLTMFCC